MKKVNAPADWPGGVPCAAVFVPTPMPRQIDEDWIELVREISDHQSHNQVAQDRGFDVMFPTPWSPTIRQLEPLKVACTIHLLVSRSHLLARREHPSYSRS
jgi:hypothetical protein